MSSRPKRARERSGGISAAVSPAEIPRFRSQARSTRDDRGCTQPHRFPCNPPYPTALALVASGQIDAKPPVTHRFPPREVTDAFAMAQDPTSHAVNVIVD